MTVTVEDVKRIYAAETADGKDPAEAKQATRTLVHALLQIESSAPGPEHVTDAHRIAADHLRARDPHMKDALHMLQKTHQTAQWQRTDELVAQAGV